MHYPWQFPRNAPIGASAFWDLIRKVLGIVQTTPGGFLEMPPGESRGVSPSGKGSGEPALSLS